jgi:hypothetical protein
MSRAAAEELAPYRDVTGRTGGVWARRAVLALLALVALAALLNRFGQHPSTSTARGATASLQVQSPTNLRGGLIFQSRFTIVAHDALRKPSLVLSRGWLESMSINSIEPDPSSQDSRNGDAVLTFPAIPAGHTYVVWIYFQTNPTNVARRAQVVELVDGARRLLSIHRNVTIWP